MAIAQPVCGRIGDRVGHATSFRLGLVLFIAASAAAALVSGFELLLLARVGQACGAALVIPNGMALIRNGAPPKKLGAYLGMTGALIALSAAIGPAVAPAILAAASWRWIFACTIPIAALSLLLSLRFRASVPARGGEQTLPWQTVALLLAVVLAASLLVEGLATDLSIAYAVAGLVPLAAAIVLFYMSESGDANPLIDPTPLQSPRFLVAASYGFVSNAVIYVVLLGVPALFVDVEGYSLQTAGALIGVMSLIVVFLSPASGRMSDRVGRTRPMITGAFLQLTGLVGVLMAAHWDASAALFGLALVLVGCGIGFGVPAASSMALEVMGEEKSGAAAGLNSMMRYLGNLFGVLVIGGSLVANKANVSLAGFQYAVLLTLLLTAALMAVSIGLVRSERVHSYASSLSR
jgi:MFS family permease